MNAGKYDKRIAFCRQRDKAESNEMSKTEQDLKIIKKVWASIKPKTTSESYELERLTNTVTFDIRTRYNKCLENTSNIIVYKGERYEIKSAVDVRGEGVELAITAVKIMKAGTKRVPYFEF